MTNRARPIERYGFAAGDELFLDANVWLRVYGPWAKADRKSRYYSNAVTSIFRAKSKVYIDALVLSEFINTYARTKFSEWKKAKPERKNIEFKTFRRTDVFVEVAEEIKDEAKRFLKHCDRCGSNFPRVNIDAILGEYAKGKSDFNDQIIAEICRDKKLTLVTDDGDFGSSSLNILTANQTLL